MVKVQNVKIKIQNDRLKLKIIAKPCLPAGRDT